MHDHKEILESVEMDSDKLLDKFSFIKHMPPFGSSFNPRKVSICISAVYIVIGCLWILFSDKMVNNLISDKHKIELISMIKGWFFVFASGIIIYLLIYYALRRIRKTEKKLFENYDEISVTYEELEASYEEVSASEEEIKQQFDELQMYSSLVEANEDRLRRAQALAKVGNWELDLQSTQIWASEEAFGIYGIELKTNILPLKEVQSVVHKDDREKLNIALKLLLEKNEKYDIEFRIVRLNDNAQRIIHSIAKIDFDRSGKPQKVLGVLQDITERKLHEETIKHLAYYDTLTDLPNRVLFTDRLKEAINTANKNNSKIAVVFFDIDNFKQINDMLGHYIGNKLLIDISKRLKSSLEVYETLARFNGDEFSIFIENITQIEDIIQIINRIKKIFEIPFNADNHTIHISSSYGISIFPDDGESADDLLKNADTAMYKAKESGRNTYQLYDDNMRDEVYRKLKIEKHLRLALENNELHLCFQPQVDIKSNKIRGVEALLRWDNKDLGMISPLEFIPIAEEAGLIIPIGEWVLEKSCETIKALQVEYNFNAIISVNISPVQLKQGDFAEKVKYILDKTGLNPKSLELEITESILIDSFDFVDMLEELKNIGVKIALDDFGSGFSSLNYLTKLPFNTLKIDKSFIDYINTNSKEEAIIESIISLIHKLELEVIAEGVENKEQLEYLIQANCDNVQGFLFFKPIIESDLKDLIKTGEI